MYFTISPTATAQPATTATSSCMATNRGTMTQAPYYNKHNITTRTMLHQAQYYNKHSITTSFQEENPDEPPRTAHSVI